MAQGSAAFVYPRSGIVSDQLPFITDPLSTRPCVFSSLPSPPRS
jgi:hypothetical protein